MKFFDRLLWPWLKKYYLWVLAGIGILLLLFSFIGNKEPKKSSGDQKADSGEVFVRETEEQLATMISKMLGAKDVQVMITLESSGETVYADTTKINQGHTEDAGADQKLRTEQKDSKENEYMILKDHEGNETAVVVTTVMPQIRGAVVVCPDGDQAVVQAMVKNVVVTALNISERKVCVVGSPN